MHPWASPTTSTPSWASLTTSTASGAPSTTSRPTRSDSKWQRKPTYEVNFQVQIMHQSWAGGTQQAPFTAPDAKETPHWPQQPMECPWRPWGQPETEMKTGEMISWGGSPISFFGTERRFRFSYVGQTNRAFILLASSSSSMTSETLSTLRKRDRRRTMWWNPGGIHVQRSSLVTLLL